MQLPLPKQAALLKRKAWLATVRSKQIVPASYDWSYFLALAGRGFGKTKLAMEDAAWYGSAHDGERIALIAPTYADARDTMVEGQSGLLSCLAPEMVETWNRSLGELILINGTRYKLFGATEPDRLRGPQHNRAYADELCAWEYSETWDQLLFGLRLGKNPQVIVTTTPKPTPLIRALIADKKSRIVRGSTFENSDNLAVSALAQLRAKYEGTRLGRQELEAEILDDVPGALWTRAMLDAARVQEVPTMSRIVVAVDPSGTSGEGEKADDVGIVVAGKGVDGLYYVLADRTCNLSPSGWGRRVAEAFHEFKADRVIVEKNFGGDMALQVIRSCDATLPIRAVNASRGKVARAEPIAALFEQGRVKHMPGLTLLEDQFCGFTPSGYVGGGSPDRADAAIWALTELSTKTAAPVSFGSYGQ